jgi:hypothetical protein
MSDSENYFSEDEIDDKSLNSDEEEEEKTFDEMYPDGITEEERVYYNKIQQKHIGKPCDDFSNFTVSTPKKKIKKVRKVRKVTNLLLTKDFFENKEEEEKSKKWKSKRLQNKKKTLGIVRKRVRKFNPRLPPPTKGQFNKKIKKTKEITELYFPKLGD